MMTNVFKSSHHALPLSQGGLWWAFLFICIVFSSCSDDVTSTYSKKNPVRCDFLVPGLYAELNSIVGSYGQAVTVRQSTNKIRMTSAASSNEYPMDATQKYFLFGLGGVIVGTNFEGTYFAYDLACPNCDRVAYRLSVSNTNEATCGHCKIKYSLNYDGVITEKPNDCIHTSPRGLYQYRIAYDGMYIHIYN